MAMNDPRDQRVPYQQQKALRPEEEPGVTLAMKRLSNVISELGNIVSQVNQRTSPVQRAEVEKTRDIAEGPSPNPCECAVAAQINHAVRMVEQQNRLLHEMIDRLEV